MDSIELQWRYFSSIDELDRSHEFLKKHGGVYVWIAKTNPHRIFYVGEGANFLRRLSEHFKEQIAGRYTEHFFSPEQDLLSFWAKEVYQANLDKVSSNSKENQMHGKFTGPSGWNHPNFMFRKIVPPLDRMTQRIEFLDSMAFAFAPIEDTDQRRAVEAAVQDSISAFYASEISRMIGRPIGSLVVPGARSNAYLIGARLKASRIPIGKLRHGGDFKKLPFELVGESHKNQAA